jgi:hypothetical protein
MSPGDVLVDDRATHHAAWEDAGGVFVHHKSARESLQALSKIYSTIAEQV